MLAAAAMSSRDSPSNAWGVQYVHKCAYRWQCAHMRIGAMSSWDRLAHQTPGVSNTYKGRSACVNRCTGVCMCTCVYGCVHVYMSTSWRPTGMPLRRL